MTNNTLAVRAGTELYCRDVALALSAAGHTPWCYSSDLGEVADEIRDAGVSVFDSLEAVPGEPEVIHGHHRLETTIAGLFFPTVPIISFCHSPVAWQEEPCRLPNVAFWVAVSESCKERLAKAEGISENRIELLLNFVDTRRFCLREPLPPLPRRALAFSNYASNKTHLPLLRDVCGRLGIELDVVGIISGKPVARPELILPRYDLVFAKARAAIEAMAVGCAVVQCDFFGTGRMVRTSNFDELRPHNFGFKTMTYGSEPGHLMAQIAAYDPDDARAVALRVRRECSLDSVLPLLLKLYERAMAHRTRLSETSMLQAAAIFAESELHWIKHGRNMSRALAKDGLVRARHKRANARAIKP